jgi:hypothetical protein
MRDRASSSRASRLPKVSAPDGQTDVHAGSSPPAWRSTHSEHLRTRGSEAVGDLKRDEMKRLADLGW